MSVTVIVVAYAVAVTLVARVLVKSVAAYHQPTKKLDSCQECHATWPCRTYLALCAALSLDPPPEQMTGCDGRVEGCDDEGPFWRVCQLDRGHEGEHQDSTGPQGVG